MTVQLTDDDLTYSGRVKNMSAEEDEILRKLFDHPAPIYQLTKKVEKKKVWFDGKLHLGDSAEIGIFSKDLNNFEGKLENKPISSRGIYFKIEF